MREKKIHSYLEKLQLVLVYRWFNIFERYKVEKPFSSPFLEIFCNSFPASSKEFRSRSIGFKFWEHFVRKSVRSWVFELANSQILSRLIFQNIYVSRTLQFIVLQTLHLFGNVGPWYAVPVGGPKEFVWCFIRTVW